MLLCLEVEIQAVSKARQSAKSMKEVQKVQRKCEKYEASAKWVL